MSSSMRVYVFENLKITLRFYALMEGLKDFNKVIILMVKLRFITVQGYKLKLATFKST